MQVKIDQFCESDLPQMLELWNAVVEEGRAFPQEEELDLQSGMEFFASQTRSAVAKNAATGEIVGLYILHPNNVGRCGHICNASFATRKDCQGMGIGRALVQDCLEKAAHAGFRLMQFNAVAASNARARSLYEKLGFERLGKVPGGFRRKDGAYEDIFIYVRQLQQD